MILMGEIAEFTSVVEHKIYEPLLVFGEEKEFLQSDVVTENREFHVMKMVGVLNDIHETIKNLNVLLKHLLNQLHCLYSKPLREYTDVFHKVLLLEAFDAIGSLLVCRLSFAGRLRVHRHDRRVQFPSHGGLEGLQDDPVRRAVRQHQVQHQRSRLACLW